MEQTKAPVVESYLDRDMKMDDLATFWVGRADTFDSALTLREETSCCGGGSAMGKGGKGT